MRIKKIEIHGLFYKYNITIDMSRKCNIIVGANGIGKTTILKIINYISGWNFIDLVQYHFINISLSVECDMENGEIKTKNICFSRADLVPNREKVIDRYQEYWHDKKTEWLENVLTFLSSQGTYCDFFYYLYKHDTNSEVVKRAIFECSNQKEVFQYFNESFVGKIEEILPYFEGRYCFYGSKIYETLDKIELGYIKTITNTYVLDLVQGVVFEKMNSSLYNSKTLKWLKMSSELGNNQIEHDDWDQLHNSEMTPIKEQMIWHLAWLQSMGSRLNIPEYFFRIDGELVLEFWKYIYQNLNDLTTYVQDSNNGDGNMLSRQDYCLKRFIDEHKFCLNDLIALKYFKEGVAEQLNKALADFCVDIADGIVGYGDDAELYQELTSKICTYLNISLEDLELWDDDDEFKERYRAESALSVFYNNPEVRFNIENYFIPILATDFPINYSEIYETVGKIEISDDDEFDYYSLCFEFYIRVVDTFIASENKSDRIQLFQERMEDYFPNRRICITPSGFRFFDKEEADGSIIPLYKMHSKEITINSISSGEKKIILLLAVAYLMDDITVLIDEPELSLSIVWQKKIMEDLKAGGLNNITVATHSPYLISSELLRQETIFLPEEEL